MSDTDAVFLEVGLGAIIDGGARGAEMGGGGVHYNSQTSDGAAGGSIVRLGPIEGRVCIPRLGGLGRLSLPAERSQNRGKYLASLPPSFTHSLLYRPWLRY